MTESIAPVTGSVISDPDAQAAIWFLGALSQVRVSGAQTGGAFALADHLARRGNASPVHVHDRDDETFFVLDGELRVFAGEEEHTAGPGTVAVLPRRLSPRLCRHLRHRAVPHPAHPGRVRAVRRRGRSSPPRPSRCPRHPPDHRTSPRSTQAAARHRHHDPGPAAPALEPGRALPSSTAVTAAPARPPKPSITKAALGEVASNTGLLEEEDGAGAAPWTPTPGVDVGQDDLAEHPWWRGALKVRRLMTVRQGDRAERAAPGRRKRPSARAPPRSAGCRWP